MHYNAEYKDTTSRKRTETLTGQFDMLVFHAGFWNLLGFMQVLRQKTTMSVQGMLQCKKNAYEGEVPQTALTGVVLSVSLYW